MEPRIQYAKTADGVSMAFWTVGDGMAIVQALRLGAVGKAIWRER